MMTSLSEPSSAEIVMDFSDSLRSDLVGNDRFAIQNLTLVAKEATFCAQELSEALVKHIKIIQPQRKLPALYVLDSIVKNVGTPYTVYLGRNLFNTFMEAYSLVDGLTRKAMEAMLKTWKEPVLGSGDPRPVFAPELVRPIENALNKVRTVAFQQQRPMLQPGYGHMPTPPQFQGYAPPPQQAGYNGHYAPLPEQYYQSGFQPTPVQQGQYQAPASQAHNDLESLKRDLMSLIRIVEQDLSRDMYNAVIQTKLKALHDLNTILHTRQLDPVEFGVIAGQVHSMSAAMLPRPQPTPPLVSAPQWQPPLPVVHQPPVSIPQTQLNGLAALLNNIPKPSTPQVRAAVPSLQHAPHAQVNAIQAQASTVPSTSGSDLLAALTKAGLMKTAAPASTPVQAPVNPVQANLAALLGSLSRAAPPAANKIDLKNKTSLETFRPELIQQLYEDQPQQCPQCGRRFAKTADGSMKKQLHLDWHFRVNQRIADSARGHYRNWYINELEWMKLDEFDQSTVTAETSNAAAKTSSKVEAQPYIKTPPGVSSTTCSICFETIKSSYMEQIQDWVFLDAVTNNGKIVHASCLAEIGPSVQSQQIAAAPSTQKSLADALAALSGQREASKTPDSTLGKRKAEDQAGGLGKILKES